MHVLGHLSVEEFLRDYWQKKAGTYLSGDSRF